MSAKCGRCGQPIPPRDLTTATRGRRGGWRCLPCTIDNLMRERAGVRAAAEPTPLHRMGRTT